MYEIKKTEYGLHVIMGGKYQRNEIRNYIKQKEKLISTIQGPYSMLVDLRTAMPPESSDARLLKECQDRMVGTEIQRMAFIVSSPVLLGSAKQVLVSSTLKDCTRIIDASRTPNWHKLALDWITAAIDPELNPKSTESVAH